MSEQSDSNGKRLQQSSDTNMFLPSVLEYIDLFKSFAVAAKLPDLTDLFYSTTEASFEIAFINIYYTTNWYINVANGTADTSNADFLFSLYNITSVMSSTTSFF